MASSTESSPPAQAASGAGADQERRGISDAKFQLLAKAPSAVVESPGTCSLGQRRDRSAVPAALAWRRKLSDESPEIPFYLAVAATGVGPEQLGRVLSQYATCLATCKGVLIAIPQSGKSPADTRRLSEAAFKALEPAGIPKDQIEVRVMPPGAHGASAATDGRAALGLGIAMGIKMADRIYDG